MSRFTTTAASFIITATIAASAQAGIVSVAGATVHLGVAPVAANPIALNGPLAFAWDEQQGVFVPPIPVNMLNNPGNSGAPVPGVYSNVVDSHMIHFAPHVAPGFNAVGSVTFAANIVAVIWNDVFLNISDPFVGAGGTAYPTGNPMRGMSLPSALSVNTNVLQFNLWGVAGTLDFEQIRVLTERVPAPGPIALLGMASLVIARRRRTR